MRIGLLTSGGDCPGLNAVIRSAVLHGIKSYGDEFVGFRGGWRGLIEGDYMEITRHDVRGLAREGGTILGTSRTHPYNHPKGGPENIAKQMKRHDIDAVIAIGGEGTLAGAKRLADDGIPVVGPQDHRQRPQGHRLHLRLRHRHQHRHRRMDRLRTTGESHHRCMVAEVMGRHVGWIALHSGMAAGAHAILIPEQKVDLDQVCEWVEQVHSRGRSPLVVVAEGSSPRARRRPWPARARSRRTPPPRRHRRMADRSHRGAHRHRDPQHHPRPHPARRQPHRLRPRPGHPLRHESLDLVHEQAWGHMASLRGTEIVKEDLASAGRAQGRAGGALRGGEDPLRPLISPHVRSPSALSGAGRADVGPASTEFC